MINLIKYFFYNINMKATLVLIAIQIFCFLGIYLMADTKYTTFEQVIKTLFAGPSSNKDFLNGISWYFPLLFSLYILGDSLKDDLSSKSEFLLLRISKYKWFFSRLLFIITFSFLLVLLKFFISLFIFIFFSDAPLFVFSNELWFFIFPFSVLMYSSLFLLYFIFYLLFNNKYTYLLFASFLLVPWLIGINLLTMYIPGAMTMLRYNIFVESTIGFLEYTNFTMIVIIITVIVGYFIIHRKEIT